MALNHYPGVEVDRDDVRQHVRRIATRINSLGQGKLNCAVEFTPEAATTSTVVTDGRITPNSVLLIEATSSGGATELAAGSMYVDATDRGAGECTVTHSTGAADELFRLIILS